MVNLSGGTGDRLKRTVEVMKGRYPKRFRGFSRNMDYDDLDQPRLQRTRSRSALKKDVKNGAQGLKIFKDFGMELHYKSGQRVHVDDPAFFSLVFEKCADLGIPVLIHVRRSRPRFFDPWDKYNERWLELKQFPQRARGHRQNIHRFETLMTERNHLFAMHPRTKFIAAHLALSRQRPWGGLEKLFR